MIFHTKELPKQGRGSPPQTGRGWCPRPEQNCTSHHCSLSTHIRTIEDARCGAVQTVHRHAHMAHARPAHIQERSASHPMALRMGRRPRSESVRVGEPTAYGSAPSRSPALVRRGHAGRRVGGRKPEHEDGLSAHPHATSLCRPNAPPLPPSLLITRLSSRVSSPPSLRRQSRRVESRPPRGASAAASVCLPPCGHHNIGNALPAWGGGATGGGSSAQPESKVPAEQGSRSVGRNRAAFLASYLG